jgi:hypothetical protein
MDALMLSLFNSREREVDDWKHLFEFADLRLQSFVAKRIGNNGSTGVISLEWTMYKSYGVVYGMAIQRKM